MNIALLDCWEANEVHSWRATALISPCVIQKLIGNSYHLMVTSGSVCIYVLMGHLLMIHIKAVHFGGNADQFDIALDQFRQMNKAVNLLHQRFSSIILIVFLSNAVDMTTCCYDLIRSLVNDEWISCGWNASQIAMDLNEMVLMCWTADRLVRSSVIYIVLLRNIVIAIFGVLHVSSKTSIHVPFHQFGNYETKPQLIKNV